MRVGGLLYAAITLRNARKRLQRPRGRAFQLYSYSRALWSLLCHESASGFPSFLSRVVFRKERRKFVASSETEFQHG